MSYSSIDLFNPHVSFCISCSRC
uniref:Uncharacterized protein n=1 Tax=Heterorhabditis bacteriophora TaxID=37862 RepID=A0A1I7WFD9_HETBA